MHFLRYRCHVGLWRIFKWNSKGKPELVLWNRRVVMYTCNRYIYTFLLLLTYLSSFLWKVCRSGNGVKVYPWTGKNEYMILSEADFIAIGGGFVLYYSLWCFWLLTENIDHPVFVWNKPVMANLDYGSTLTSSVATASHARHLTTKHYHRIQNSHASNSKFGVSAFSSCIETICIFFFFSPVRITTHLNENMPLFRIHCLMKLHLERDLYSNTQRYLSSLDENCNQNSIG